MEPKATFTDEQVTEACGLHVDNLRRLITWKSAIPFQGGGGRGKVRLWNIQEINRIIAISTVFKSGFSLKMSNTLIHCLPLIDFLSSVDPLIPNVDRLPFGTTEFLRRLQDPDVCVAEDFPDDPGHITIVDGKYVIVSESETSHKLCGFLDEKKSVLTTYHNPDQWHFGDFTGAWYPPSSYLQQIDRSSLSFRLADNDTHPDETAENLLHRAAFYTRINLNIGLFIGHRRLFSLPLAI